MRVLMLDQTGQLGGAEFAMLELCERAAFDWSAILFSDGPFRERLEALGKPVEVVSATAVTGVRRNASFLGALKSVTGALTMISRIVTKAKSVDVIYANTQKAMVIGAIVGFMARKPVVWYLHDIVTPAHFAPTQLRLIKWMTQHLIKKVVCNSEASRDALVALTGNKSSRYELIYNGISAEPFEQAGTTSRETLRAQYALPEQAFLVGCFSRLAKWKGQHVLLKALVDVPTAHAVLVGDALFGEQEYAQYLRTLVTSLGLEERVHFVGFQADIPSLMHAMDAVVHTSISPEPFGRVVVEGMLAGRPVLASRAGGLGEIIQHMKNGILITPDKPEALARGLQLLQSDPELASRLGAEGKSRARQKFGPTEHVRRMTEVLRGCAARSGAASGPYRSIQALTNEKAVARNKI